jgi:hypothetical protein
MPVRRTALALLCCAIALAACRDEGPELIPAELAGDWVAEPACRPPCSLEFRSVANPDVRIELIDLLGITIDVRLRRNGEFLLTIMGQPPIGGTARVEGTRLVVRAADGTEEIVDYQLGGVMLTLDFQGQFDFNLDGETEAAAGRAVLRKR